MMKNITLLGCGRAAARALRSSVLSVAGCALLALSAHAQTFPTSSNAAVTKVSAAGSTQYDLIGSGFNVPSGFTLRYKSGSTFQWDSGTVFGGSSSAFRTAAGVAIGTNVQAWSAQLDSVAALATTGLMVRTAANTVTARTITAGAGISVSNGDGVAANPTVSANVTSVAGRTGAVTIASTDITDSTATGRSVVIGTTQNANIVFAGPSSGAAAAPTFRSVVQADIQTAESPNRNALSPRAGIVFDGTSNARINSTLTGQNIGTDPFSINAVFRVPSSVPAADVVLCGVGPNNTTFAGVFNRFEITLKSQADLQIAFQDGTNTRIYIVSGWVTTNAGKVVMITVTRNGSTPTLYVNGVVQTLSDQGGGGDPGGSITSTYLNVGFRTSTAVLISTVYSVTFYNLALSASDVQEIFELGGAVPYRFQFGSQTEQISATVDRDMSGANNWQYISSTGSVSGGVMTFAGAADTQRLMLSPSFFGTWAGKGKQYRFKATLSGYAVTGGATLQLRLGVTNPLIGTWPGNGTTSFEFAPDDASGSQNIGFWQNGTGTTAATIDNASLVRIGAVVHLPFDEGYGYELKDTSTNRLHAVMTLPGISHLIAQNRSHHFRGTTNTNGNQQMLGVPLIPANSQILKVRARAQTNTPTITIGNASGGAQIVASIALSTTWKDLTIALTGGIVTADTSLWIGSNSTDVVEIDVTAEPLSP